MSLIVTDEHNHQVNNITQADIQVVEDGKLLKIVRFEKDARPLAYTIAIDASSSFEHSFPISLQLAKKFIENNRAEDETMLMAFAGSKNIVEVQPFTNDKARLLEGVAALQALNGATAFIDAAYIIVQTTASHRAGSPVRRAVVLFSDGDDLRSYYKPFQLERLLHETDVQVFVLGNIRGLASVPGVLLPQLRWGSTRDDAWRLLHLLAAESGGRIFLPKTTGELVEAAKEINASLDSQYLVTFESAKPGQKNFQKVKLSLVPSGKTEKLIAVTRPGYFLGQREASKKN